MKKLMTRVVWGFTALVVAGLAASDFLTAQNTNSNKIALVKEDSKAIDIVVEASVTDDQLGSLVNSKIKDFLFYGVYDYIKADVSEGVVVLTGWVHEAWIADVLTKKLSKIEGVKNVDNRIQTSFGSEDLARQAVRAIYSDAMFDKYTFGADPPIHVVVNNNTIMLEGTAANAAERDRAAYLVDFKTTAMTVSNQLELKP